MTGTGTWRRLAAMVALMGVTGVLVGGLAALPAGARGSRSVAARVAIGPEHPVAPTVVDGPGGAGDQAVAFDGTNYLVVWSGLGGVRAARLSQTGALLDPRPLLVTAEAGHGAMPQVAFDGTNYLVVWATSDDEPSDIRGARVSTGGTVIDPEGFPIATGPDHDRFPVVAFDGTNYL